MKDTSIALLGLGTMGVGMAANLLKAGFSLAVYNRTSSRSEPFVSQGARIAHTPADAARNAQIIISMLSDDAASRAVWTGPNGALEAADKGAILVESSTVSPTWVMELAALAAKAGVQLIDAPVTGSRVHAEGAQLNFLVGGDETAVATVMPAFQAMGKSVTHLGPVGSGAKLKLINNFLCGVQAASLAEALVWIERSGLDRDQALQVLRSGAPGSPLLAGLSARMTARDYTVNFLLKLMSKDLEYAHHAAAELGIDLTTAANARALFENAVTSGYGEQDMSSVVESLRASAQK
ncbi:MAG: NAD(P)-dependent oxidoreductase [Granulicella sp.]